MELSEYLVMFALVILLGAGVPGPGDASLLAAGTLAGEGRLNIWVVLGLAVAAWMVGSVIGYWVGFRGGRTLLDRPRLSLLPVPRGTRRRDSRAYTAISDV
jgi:membrane protein DedA with SNARE-associated domain